MDNASIKKLEADLWESADLLRAGSKLTSVALNYSHYPFIIILRN